ncbi:hypothetical protein BLA14095_00429 [Burkholderia lata]|uniref:hypothetical protein n=1 Tax=Burkholderia lata (strain ATCC 17760 / DSM 23089 / LMG 22485 / NCIMB 9086 / R18194 / 383) TaxID=482957 RepID=UPI001453632D|nr:hypothetical protein [Burkholderia lata]VWB15315.1 hypothetical protein BLA14095_00429 [Burkholderia lata]
MDHIAFSNQFSLLSQESHLTKNTILSGFDLLLKANFYQDKDGYFYSAFFHLSIGLERILKLALVTHHMLANQYRTPTIKQLKAFGHDIKSLSEHCNGLVREYSSEGGDPLVGGDGDAQLIEFISEYGVQSRYFNLNEICEAKMNRSPLYKWLDVAIALYHAHTAAPARERAALNLMYKMDRAGLANGFTYNLTEAGHPMTQFDCFHRQYVIEKAAPLAIWRIVENFRPIHFLLESMASRAREYEAENGIARMVIPHYEDFFYFLLAEKDSVKRRRQWTKIFNS